MTKKTTKKEEKTNTELQNLEGFELPLKEIGIEPKQFSLSQIKRMIRDGKLTVPKDFQREEIYKTAQKQAVIESALLQKPIPSLFVYQPDKNKLEYLVIDGQQRLSSFRDFFDGTITFKSYDERLEKLNGYTYEQIPMDILEEINDLQLDFQILYGTNLDEIQRYYTLLNSTSQPLSPGELFYAIPNPAHKFFKEAFNMAIINRVMNSHRKAKWILIARLFFLFVEGDIKNHDYLGKPVTTMLRYFNSVDEHTMSDLWNKVRHLLNTVNNAIGDCTLPIGADQMFNWICAISTINENYSLDSERLQRVLTCTLNFMKNPQYTNPDYKEEIDVLVALQNSSSAIKVNTFCTTFETLYCAGDKLWELSE